MACPSPNLARNNIRQRQNYVSSVRVGSKFLLQNPGDAKFNISYTKDQNITTCSFNSTIYKIQ